MPMTQSGHMAEVEAPGPPAVLLPSGLQTFQGRGRSHTHRCPGVLRGPAGQETHTATTVLLHTKQEFYVFYTFLKEFLYVSCAKIK